MFALLPLLAVGTAALLWFDRLTVGRHQPFAPMGPQMMHAGIPYRFVVRMETGSGSADTITRLQATARAVLAETKSAATTVGPTFVMTDRPPPWNTAQGSSWGRMLCMFDVTLIKSEPVTIGTQLPGFGTIESVQRLDGKNFTDPA